MTHQPQYLSRRFFRKRMKLHIPSDGKEYYTLVYEGYRICCMHAEMPIPPYTWGIRFSIAIDFNKISDYETLQTLKEAYPGIIETLKLGTTETYWPPNKLFVSIFDRLINRYNAFETADIKQLHSILNHMEKEDVV